MGRMLYAECASGISGDMTVGALLDLGADKEKLLQVLDTVPADGFRVEISRVKKSGIDCMDFDVILDAAHENHDHDMEYLYGHEHEGHHGHCHRHDAEHEEGHHGHCHRHDAEHEEGHHGHCHGHDTEHEEEHHCCHAHDAEHAHDGHHHHHEHRGLPEILRILDDTRMEESARALAKRVFTILAEAEARAHGIPVEEVHFHEVGAIDSIVDIIAIAVCFDDLKITDVIVKSVTEGTGTVRCQHGILPVPVPAVTAIAQRYALPIRIADVRGELVTPTGAAFLAAVSTSNTLPESFRIQATGLGAGKRTYELPGFLRMMIIDK